jgi:hypothetical protein
MAADNEAQAAADIKADAHAILAGTGAPLRHNSLHSPTRYLVDNDEMLSMIWRRKDPIGGRWPR